MHEATCTCGTCGRRLTHPRSKARRHGPVCHKRRVKTENIPLPEAMWLEGYRCGHPTQWADPQHIVTNPEGDAYLVDLEDNTCTCMAYERDFAKFGVKTLCKHVVFARWDIARREAEKQALAEDRERRRADREAKAQRKMQRDFSNVQAEIAQDFA